MARTDVQLMLGVKAGDDSSFALLLAKYRTPLIHFLGRMVKDPAMAEDLAQEVFLRVYRARKSYAPSAKFTTWMFRIATNLALNALRDQRHHRRQVSIEQPGYAPPGGSQPSDDEQPLDVPDRRPSIVEQMLARDRAIVIQRAILALPAKQRAAVLMHKYHELDYDQIADALDCSESALKSLLFRAYQTLRVELAPLIS